MTQSNAKDIQRKVWFEVRFEVRFGTTFLKCLWHCFESFCLCQTSSKPLPNFLNLRPNLKKSRNQNLPKPFGEFKILSCAPREGWSSTGQDIRQIWAEWAVCVSCYLLRGTIQDLYFFYYMFPHSKMSQKISTMYFANFICANACSRQLCMEHFKGKVYLPYLF